MNAKQAAKLSEKYRLIAQMPCVYKEIRAAAKEGKTEVIISKYSGSKENMDSLIEYGYAVSELYESDVDIGGIFIGWKVQWHHV